MVKNKMKLSDYLNFNGIAYGFFMIFFMIYIGKFDLTNLILTGTTVWDILFNIGVWFVLVMFCINNFFDAAVKTKQRRLEKHVKMKEKK